MSHPYHHALSSARRFGGVPEDYLAIHSWFDASKELMCDPRHRALRHHAQGIFEAERVFSYPRGAGHQGAATIWLNILCVLRKGATCTARNAMEKV